MAATEEDGHRLEAEVSRLMVERTSLLLDLEASRDEVSTLHSQAAKDKEALVEDYQKALEQIFAYGYGCCAFKHGIRGDRPRILGMRDSADPLPPKFFVNLGYPSTLTVVEAKVVEVYPIETMKDLVEGIFIEEQTRWRASS